MLANNVLKLAADLLKVHTQVLLAFFFFPFSVAKEPDPKLVLSLLLLIASLFALILLMGCCLDAASPEEFLNRTFLSKVFSKSLPFINTMFC